MPVASAHLQAVVAVAGDALVHRQQEQVQPVVVPLVQLGHHVDQHSRVCVPQAGPQAAAGARGGGESEVCSAGGLADLRFPSHGPSSPLPPDAAKATRWPRWNIPCLEMVW